MSDTFGKYELKIDKFQAGILSALIASVDYKELDAEHVLALNILQTQLEEVISG